MFNIACKVMVMNITIRDARSRNSVLVFGFLSKLKNGPTIIRTRPSIEEIKNLGKRNAFSQKSGILYLVRLKFYIVYFNMK